MENKNKRRGSNYTASEKQIVLELVNKYKHIIENKETNAAYILKKRETWAKVTQEYNSLSSSGVRTWQQLRHLYENIKQRSKKNIAKENRNQFYQKEIKLIKNKASNDKKELNLTGGGTYRSTLTAIDEQVLAMVAPQVQPLQNAYDDAAFYFDDDNNHIQSSQEITISDEEQPMEVVQAQPVEVVQEQPVLVVQEQPMILTSTSTHESRNTSTVKTKSNRTPLANLKENNRLNQNTKGQYFKTKLKNAKLESRYLISKHKMEVSKYKLEMEILKLRLKKLQGQRR